MNEAAQAIDNGQSIKDGQRPKESPLRPPIGTEPAQLVAGAVPVFKALADPARLKMLQHLARPEAALCCRVDGAVCACDFESVTGLSQPTVSHHMKILLAAGLVSGEKIGKWMHYRLEPAGLQTIKTFLAAVSG